MAFIDKIGDNDGPLTYSEDGDNIIRTSKNDNTDAQERTTEAFASIEAGKTSLYNQRARVQRMKAAAELRLDGVNRELRAMDEYLGDFVPTPDPNNT